MRVKRGDIVEVIFLDHVSTTNGVGSLMKCISYGRVLNVDKNALYIASWLTDEFSDVDNMNTTTILKTAIEKIHILTRRKQNK